MRYEQHEVADLDANLVQLTHGVGQSLTGLVGRPVRRGGQHIGAGLQHHAAGLHQLDRPRRPAVGGAGRDPQRDGPQPFQSIGELHQQPAAGGQPHRAERGAAELLPKCLDRLLCAGVGGVRGCVLGIVLTRGSGR